MNKGRSDQSSRGTADVVAGLHTWKILAQIKRTAEQAYGRLVNHTQIRRYLRTVHKPCLNLGCGHNILEGWLNVDLEGGRHGTVFMDASRRWPLHDDIFDAILCEHTIEHLPKETGRHILFEALRVLKPGGQIRVVTPDLATVATLVRGSADPASENYLRFVAELHHSNTLSATDAVNYLFYEYGHRYIYSSAELKRHFEVAGFTEIRETRAGYPHSALFHCAEGHANFMGLENDAFEAFALEGTKPLDSTPTSLQKRSVKPESTPAL